MGRDWIDYLAIGGAGLLLFSVLGAAYWLTWIDFRAWLRSLTRTLINTTQYVREMPLWAQRLQTPRCLEVFGLKLPCSELELLAAYRVQIKKLHPDHGGDQQRFMQLQTYFEQAQKLVREQKKA